MQEVALESASIYTNRIRLFSLAKATLQVSSLLNAIRIDSGDLAESGAY
jgi:hypothetical protein